MKLEGEVFRIGETSAARIDKVKSYFDKMNLICDFTVTYGRIKSCGCFVPYSRKQLYEFHKRSRKVKPEKVGRGIKRRTEKTFLMVSSDGETWSVVGEIANET